MIIALPSTDHDHLADALVRDLGFTRSHVDAPVRELLLALDPFVDSGVTMANRGPSPRLSSKLEQLGGHDPEDRWHRLLNPPRPGSSPNGVATEVARMLDVLRRRGLGDRATAGVDTVLVGVETVTHLDRIVYGTTPSGAAAFQFVAIRGRFETDCVNYWITPAGVVGEQEAIVAYVRELREPKVTVDDFKAESARMAALAAKYEGKTIDELATEALVEDDDGPGGRQSSTFADALAEAGYTSQQIDAARSGPPLSAAARAALLREAAASVALDGETFSIDD